MELIDKDTKTTIENLTTLLKPVKENVTTMRKEMEDIKKERLTLPEPTWSQWLSMHQHPVRWSPTAGADMGRAMVARLGLGLLLLVLLLPMQIYANQITAVTPPTIVQLSQV